MFPLMIPPLKRKDHMPSHKKKIREEKRQLEQDEAEESVAINELGLFLSFTSACTESEVDPLLSSQWESFKTIKDRKGNVLEKKTEIIRAQDVLIACHKFIANNGYDNAKLIELSQADKLSYECIPWLQKYKERYNNLSSSDTLELRKCVRKAFRWIILENMYRGWLGCPNKSDSEEDFFVNDDHRKTYEKSYHDRVLHIPGTASVTHKVVREKEPENRQQLATDLIHKHYEESAQQLADPTKMEEALNKSEAKKIEKRKQAKRRNGNDETGEVAV